MPRRLMIIGSAWPPPRPDFAEHASHGRWFSTPTGCVHCPCGKHLWHGSLPNLGGQYGVSELIDQSIREVIDDCCDE